MASAILFNQTVTTSGQSGPFQSDSFGTVTVNVLLSVVGGTTPSYIFQLQSSPDGANWFNVNAPTAPQTANGGVTLSSAPGAFDGAYARVTWVVTGATPTANVEIWMDGR